MRHRSSSTETRDSQGLPPDVGRTTRPADDSDSHEKEADGPACPVCGGRLVDIRRKLCCEQCHSIVETCCD
jgi:hypothetical protein